ncbi:hypothetical protein FRB95_011993 [Tulasnella sp. JGI-2019a]|nr:hypothetical protein FRB95_011993 [Tulasnella sp. JGI-2019a]
MLPIHFIHLILPLLSSIYVTCAPLLRPPGDLAGPLYGVSASCTSGSSRPVLQRRVHPLIDIDEDEVQEPVFEEQTREDEAQDLVPRPQGTPRGVSVGLGAALAGKYRGILRHPAPVPVVHMKCQCCYEDASVTAMVFCRSDHAFCKACGETLAGIVIPQGRTDIHCMAPGCEAVFRDNEIFKFLPESQMNALNKNRALKDIRESGIKAASEGCPVCQNVVWLGQGDENTTKMDCEVCGHLSCIPCNMVHDGLECAEYKQNQVEHAINEAQSRALIRSCPGCQQRFIKEDNRCNFIECPGCHVTSCYVCNKAIG